MPNSDCNNNEASALRSTDGDQTWALGYGDTSANGGNGFERYYWGGSLNNKIYSQAQNTNPLTPMRVFDGATNTAGTWGTADQNICGAYAGKLAETFDGALVCPSPNSSNKVTIFDDTNARGVQFTPIYDSVQDFYVAKDGYLYLLSSAGSIYRTNSLSRPFEKIGTTTGVSGQAASILVYNDSIYIGGDYGVIYKSDIKVSDLSPLLPVAQSIAPNSLVATDTMQDVTINGQNLERVSSVTVGGVAVPFEYQSNNDQLVLHVDNSKFPAQGGKVTLELVSASGNATYTDAISVTKTQPLDTYTWMQNFTGTQVGCPIMPQNYNYGNMVHDSAGNVYVAVNWTDKNMIQKYDQNGKVIGSFGVQGDGEGQFAGMNIGGIALDEARGYLYVIDGTSDANFALHNRVLKFTLDGNYVSTIGSYGTGPGQFNQDPRGIVVMADGSIFVSDTLNNRVEKFGADGTFIAEIPVSMPAYQGGMAVDAQQNVYVVDNNHNVIKADGATTAVLGTYAAPQGMYSTDSIAVDSNGNLYMGIDSSKIIKYDTSFNQVTSYPVGYLPAGITVLSGRTIFVSDPWNGQIRKYDASFNQLATFKYIDPNFVQNPASDFCSPNAMTKDSDGNLYVVDTSWANIKKFDIHGNQVAIIPAADNTNLAGVFYGNGFLYLCTMNKDTGLVSIEKHNPDGSLVGTIPVPIDFQKYISLGGAIGQDGKLYFMTTTAQDPSQVTVYSITTDGQMGTALSFAVSKTDPESEYPRRIVVGVSGQMDLVFPGQAAVRVYQPDGTLLSQYQLANGWDLLPMFVDDKGNSYSASNNQIYKFAADGTRLAIFGKTCDAGATEACFSGVSAIYVDTNGYVYVSDYYNKFVSIWNAPIIPSEPLAVAAQAVTATSANITWTSPQYVGSAPITHYVVRYRIAGTDQRSTKVVSGTATSMVIDGLLPNTKYEFSVLAVNSLGASVPSVSITLTTATATGDNNLAVTGQKVMPVALQGAAAIAAGLLLMATWNARRAYKQLAAGVSTSVTILIWYTKDMLDIRFIRENAAQVQDAAQQKGYSVDISELLRLDDSRRELQRQVDELRTRRNENAAKMKGGKPEQSLIDEGKQIKIELAEREEYLRNADTELNAAMAGVPNIIFEDVPLGGEEDSVEIKTWGDKKQSARDHLDFATERGWLDFERGAKVAGTKFYYVKGDLMLLENAITQFALNKLVQKGFMPMTVPHMVSTRVASGAGFAPKSDKESNEYFIDGEDMMLIGTAEAPLTGFHADEIINESELPLLYAGYSPCYRKEAGAAGKFSRGLFRVHQFNKLEMYAFCLPEKSTGIHQMILETEEEIWQELGVPYHIINIAAGDLGAPAAKKYDLEYWSPVDGMYRELTSCSNCTDFQARNLNIRVRRTDGNVEVLHTLNGTAVSLARSLVAVLENYQNEDGSLAVPEALRAYMGGRERI